MKAVRGYRARMLVQQTTSQASNHLLRGILMSFRSIMTDLCNIKPIYCITQLATFGNSNIPKGVFIHDFFFNSFSIFMQQSLVVELLAVLARGEII